MSQNEVKYQIERGLRHHLSFAPTSNQEEAIQNFAKFLCSGGSALTFLLKGYAGTGKTSLIAAIVKTLKSFEVKTILMAPTGRAAKVASTYSGEPASTIHKRIYFRKRLPTGSFVLTKQPNLFKNTLFIVDEASMISDAGGDWSMGNSLLQDIFDYVFTGENCRLMLVGDDAQLPPVGCEESPALDPEYLNSAFHLNLHRALLKEVVRQQGDSGILYNATLLRIALLNEACEVYPKFDVKGFEDVKRISSAEMSDSINASYSKYGIDGTIIICRSNKRAYQFNQEVRNRILYLDSEIQTGDYVMIVKNNYFWTKDIVELDFLANGDRAQLLKIHSFKEIYGFHFATAVLELLDVPNQPHVEVIVILDALASEAPSLSTQQQEQLYNAVMEDYAEIGNKQERIKLVKENPYYNAVQLKFAYAVTCHKSQGGQWNHVYIDQGYFLDEMLNTEFYRWIYTAITRATDTVFWINFKDEFFE